MDEHAFSPQQQLLRPATSPSHPNLSPTGSQRSYTLAGTIARALLGILALAAISLLIFYTLPFLKREKNEVTLTFWGFEEASSMQAVFLDFEKKHPRIKVSYVKQDRKQYRERLTTRVQNRTGPDVFAFHNSWLPMVVGLLSPLPNDVIGKKDFEAWFYPTAKKDLVRNGAIYGIPLSIDTLVLFANTAIFKASGTLVPTTWGEFVDAARLLTVKNEDGKIKTAGAAMGTFDNVTNAPEILSLLFVQNGVDLANLGQARQSVSDTFAFYTSFVEREAVWSSTLEDSATLFAKGNLALYFGFSDDVRRVQGVNPNLVFEVHSVPTLQGRNQTIARYQAAGVSAKSRHQNEAMLLVRFLAEKETQKKLPQPARVELAQNLKENVLLYPFVLQANVAVSTFFASGTQDNGLNEAANAYLANAVRSMLATTSAQSASDTLIQGITQVLAQYETQK